MTDMREAVAKSLHESFGYGDDEIPEDGNLYSRWSYSTADRTIAAATPFIRAALYDELIAIAKDSGLITGYLEDVADEDGNLRFDPDVTIARWLEFERDHMAVAESQKETNQ